MELELNPVSSILQKPNQGFSWDPKDGSSFLNMKTD
jgi:hypothetical protein